MYATEDWQMPEPLLLNNLIKEFGATAILGGPLGVDEIADIRTIQDVVSAQTSCDEAADDWSKWIKENPDAVALLGRARDAAVELGYVIDG